MTSAYVICQNKALCLVLGMKIFRSVVTNEKNVGVELGKSVSIDAPHKRLRKLDFYTPL